MLGTGRLDEIRLARLVYRVADPDMFQVERLRTLAAEGRTVFVSSHLIGELARTADHVLVIGRGRLLADTSVAELSARAASLEDAFLELTS